MNTITADKEITFKLFYRKNRKPGMVDVNTAIAAVEKLARQEGWEFAMWDLEESGRWIFKSARKPAFAWAAVANRAGIEV